MFVKNSDLKFDILLTRRHLFGLIVTVQSIVDESTDISVANSPNFSKLFSLLSH